MFRDFIFKLLHRRKHLHIHRNVYSFVSSDSSIIGPGVLDLGVKWNGLRYLESEFCMTDNSKLIVTGGFKIYTGFHISISKGATLKLGSGYINNRVTIDCYNSISIGDGVIISKGVTIRDSDNHYINGNLENSAPIVIEDNVWIGLNVTILKGVKIENGSVIAAGSVVTKDVKRNTLVGGVPARVIKENITWH